MGDRREFPNSDSRFKNLKLLLLNLVKFISMKACFLLVSLISVVVIHAQKVNIDTIKEVNPYNKIEYIFPQVVVKNKPAISNAINRSLIEEVLGELVDTTKGSLFSGVWGDETNITSLYIYNFTTTYNSRKILSMTFDLEGCGAYCEGYFSPYNYDLNDGSLITLEKLFTESGLCCIRDSITRSITSQIKEVIVMAKDSVRNSKLDPEDRDYYEAMASMYEECLKNGFYTSKFYIQNDSLVLLNERCSSHAERALDELGGFEHRFSLRKLKPYMSSYGRKTLLK